MRDKAKARARSARYYAENRVKARERAAGYRAENPEKVRETRAKYRVGNLEKVKARAARYKAENPEKVRAADAQKSFRSVSLLTDNYVAKVMGLHTDQVPPELLELKREQLKHKRALKELKEFLTEEGKSK